MLLMALLLQAAAAPASQPAQPERFSILLPQCPKTNAQGDVVVCSGGPDSSRIPLPDDTGPADHAVPSNPNLTGGRALEIGAPPCAARQGGCQVGFGPPLIPMAVAAFNAVKSAFAKKPDKRGRVDIPLDDPVPPTTAAPAAAATTKP